MKIRERFEQFKSLIISWLIPAAMLLVFSLVKNNKSAAIIYAKRFSLPLRRSIGSITSLIPFSVAEVFYAGAFIIAFIYLLRTLLKILDKASIKGESLRRILSFIFALLFIWALYCLVFGVDYYAESFKDKAYIGDISVSYDELLAVTRYFAEKCADFSKAVPRDENLLFAESASSIIAKHPGVYDEVSEIYPFLDMPVFQPKEMVFSKIMSYMGFTGVYFPFTGETNINVDAPRAFMPATVCHEIAHQMGITNEGECNFLGILAATTSGTKVYEYSGYLTGLLHLMNTLYTVDTAAWYEIRNSFTPEMNADWEYNNQYWDDHEIAFTAFSEKVYDGYLKNYGDELGIVSYSACVELLVFWYRDLV